MTAHDDNLPLTIRSRDELIPLMEAQLRQCQAHTRAYLRDEPWMWWARDDSIGEYVQGGHALGAELIGGLPGPFPLTLSLDEYDPDGMCDAVWSAAQHGNGAS